MLEEVFGLNPDANGALAVLSDSGDLVINNRIYNLPSAKVAGTFGQWIPGVPNSEMIESGQVQRITFMSQNSDLRANLGCVNGKNENIRIFIDLFDDTGDFLETQTMDLGPWSNKQINKIFEDYAPINGYADVYVDEGGARFYCYGSVLDNQTSDPTTVVPQ